MSIYDNRETPAYGDQSVELRYSENPHILAWWTLEHDDLILKQIRKEHWLWSWNITDALLAITPKKTIDQWKQNDPLCETYAWYNIIMYFAMSRAKRIDFIKYIRRPEWKVCPLCQCRFIESSLPVPLAERLGFNDLDFCAPCLSNTIFDESGDDNFPREEVITYLRELSDILDGIPHQGFGSGKTDLLDLDIDTRVALLARLKRKPTTKRVKGLFGSWLQALMEAGVLEGGTRRTSRGTQCIARDGHICLSLAEKMIDDILYKHGIVHLREPKYPEGRYRADFGVDDVLIEYFGLVGDANYDSKIRTKKAICRRRGIELLSIYPKDLVRPRKLEEELMGRFGTQNSSV